MTTAQLILMNGVYLVVLIAVVYLTRASIRRVAGALAAGVAIGLVALGSLALGEKIGWWQIPMQWTPLLLFLLYSSLVISCAPIYLVIWRVVRRYGWRGLAAFAVAAAIIGPIRDYRVAATFHEWIVFASGVAPILAVAMIYVMIVILGYAVMRLIAGPAHLDRLAQRRRDST